jgi:hypothetical protein
MGSSARDILQNPSEKGKREACLISKLAVKGCFLLAKVITRTALHIHKDPRQANPLEIRPVFSVKRLAAGANKPLNTGTFKSVERRFEVFVILDGDRIHTKGSTHLHSIAHRTTTTCFATPPGSVGTF